ncbi:hypothetical protein C7974DRAFT_148065 [Boeremia exigua]|uniref:uncharacterized protein n=1 Tax=Boeremia exigua TaxID=749465 RepID=UPI001E8D9D44|nr:uncharacterized protein C7974DRAFT_148065 [Boeremia exigua]KAH6637768.1 hypothetical protein C7974DRAFT_148065 [Boeremia exigua]
MASRSTESTATPATTVIAVVDLRSLRTDRKDYSRIVQVHVGCPDIHQCFFVHESLLTTRSQFFKKAMEGPWIEAESRVVRLTEDDPVTFQLYVDLLYTGRVAVLRELPSDDPRSILEKAELAKLYVLAEKLQDMEAKNQTINAVIASSRFKQAGGSVYAPGYNFIRIIYDGTPSGSKMRKLLVELYTMDAASSWIDSYHEFPCEFMEALLKSVLDLRKPRLGLVNTADVTRFMETPVVHDT